MQIRFASDRAKDANVVVTALLDKCALPSYAAELNKKSGGLILNACSFRKFKGKKGESFQLLFPAGLGMDCLVVVGLGEGKKFKEKEAQELGGSLVSLLNGYKLEKAAFVIDAKLDGSKLSAAEIAANVAFGARLKSYRFDTYRTKEPEDKKPTLKELTLITAEAKQAEAHYKELGAVADAVFFTRDLVSEPSNVIYPVSFAEKCKELTKVGLEVDVLDKARMTKLGMGALLGVAQGSANEPRMVSMRWNGAGKGKAKTIAFIGKGVTFDSGGISIKPAGGMEEMKWDMAGAAVVTGLMRALAARKAKVNAVGVIGLVENMPSGTAQRPGDVVKTMSGQTVEVINTDAEGRLVLADVLWYAQETFKPDVVIDLATLTGAVIIALGSHQAGLFSNDDDLLEDLQKAGKAVGELLWPLPLGEYYDKQINSDIADIRNVGEGREAGSTAGAIFLQRFIQEGVKWAHLDIAGVAWSKKDSDLAPKGATAFGLRLLNHFVEERFEK